MEPSSAKRRTKPRDSKIHYFPLYEITVFVLILIVTILFWPKLGLWLTLLISFTNFFVTLGDSKCLFFQTGVLKIISLNPFGRSHNVPLETIQSVTTSENLRWDTAASGQAYPELHRKYYLQYIDEKKRNVRVNFSIYNAKKEKLLLEALNFKKVSAQ